jgi:hypothetical protein
MHKTSFLRISAALSLFLLAACQQGAIKDAIDDQFGQYPESRVTDIYKNFCQDNLGPGHLIPNPQSARDYLLSELQEYREDLDSARYDKPALRYTPVGDKHNYVRVDLSVVLDGLIDEETLLDAFVRSANEGRILSEKDWVRKWHRVADVIRRRYPDIPGAEADLAALDSLVGAGDLIMHHSDAFDAAYHPHYRIVARDIFENELLKSL